MTRSTHLERHIAAPRAAVYRALIDADAIAQWMVPDGMRMHVHLFEPREGGRFRMSLRYDDAAQPGKSDAHTDTYHGRFLQLVPDTRVVETMEFESDDPSMHGTMTATFTLHDADGGTRLVARHDDVPPGVALADNEAGWAMSLDKLVALLEAGRSHA